MAEFQYAAERLRLSSMYLCRERERGGASEYQPEGIAVRFKLDIQGLSLFKFLSILHAFNVHTVYKTHQARNKHKFPSKKHGIWNTVYDSFFN